MSVPVIVSADQLEPEHVKRITEACEGWAECNHVSQDLSIGELTAMLKNTEVLIGWTNSSLIFDSSLKAYLCGSAGFDAYVGIGLDRKVDFRLTNAAGTMSKPIAEHCLAMMLALTRQLPAIFQQQINHVYERRWKVGELNETSVCIVGLGGSGTELAHRCRAMGMETIGVCRTPLNHQGITDKLYPMSAIIDAVAEADHVVAVVPGGPATRHLFNKYLFAAMKPGACYYTASRGSVTNEDELISALTSGHLGGAGLDVFAQEPLPSGSPLWDIPNVIVSPHTAGLSTRLNDRLTALFIDNLERYRDGRPLINLISPDQLAGGA